MKVLFVEDDYSIAMGLEYSLKQVRRAHLPFRRGSVPGAGGRSY